MTDALSLRISSLTDGELVRLLTVDAAQYREEALDLARSEASRRGLVVGDAAVEAPAGSRPVGAALGNAVRAFGQGFAAQLSPGRYTAAGKVVLCPHCGHDAFDAQTAVVNTRGLTFFGLDWLDKGATVLACATCGRIEWFRTPPARASE